MWPRSNLPLQLMDIKRSPGHILAPVGGLREHHPTRVLYQGDRKQGHGILDQLGSNIRSYKNEYDS